MKPAWRTTFAALVITAGCSLNNNGIIDINHTETNGGHPRPTDDETDSDSASEQSTESGTPSDTDRFGTCDTPLSFNDLAEEVSPGVYQVAAEMPERPSEHSGRCSMSGAPGPEMVYIMESPMDGPVEIRLEGDDPLLYIRRGCDDPAAEVACNDDYEGTNSAVYLNVSAGETYYLFADVFSEDDVAPFVLTIDTDPPPPTIQIPDGAWEAPALGIGLTAEDDNIEWFEITDTSCYLWMAGLIQNFEGIIEGAEVTTDGDLALSLSGGLVPDVLSPVDALPELCADGGMPMAGDDDYERDPMQIFDLFTTTFRSHYPFFEKRGIDWDALTDEYRCAVTDDISDEDLFDLLAEMIQPLDDYHVYIENDNTSVESGTPPAIEMFLKEFETSGEDDFFEYLWEQLELLAENSYGYLMDDPEGDPEVFAWGRLADDVGYLRITEFDGYDDEFAAAVEWALDDLADTEILVIDVRINFGGGDHLGLLTAGHFTDTPVDAMTINLRYKDEVTESQTVQILPVTERYNGQIVVMTSDSTPSAGETFVLMMRALPQVTLFGESTMGIFASRIGRMLPNGWTFGVPKRITKDMDGDVFEVSGIPPDVPSTPMLTPLEERLMGVDLGLEALIDWLASEDRTAR